MNILLFIFGLLMAAEDYRLGLGENLSFKIKSEESIRLEKKGILTVTDEGDRVTLTGKKIGSTWVQLGNRKYTVHVVDKKSRDTLKNLKRWLEGKRGPELSLKNQRIVVGGRLLRYQDFLSLGEERVGDNWQNQMQLAPSLEIEIKSYLTNLLKSQNLEMGDMIFYPQWQMALGSQFKNSLPLYKKNLKPYGIDIVLDPQQHTQKPMVKIKVIIAHIKKSFLRDWGVQWPSQFSATLIAQQKTQWEALSLSLNALESTGQGQILASPTLVTQSGSVAQFHSGGEFPIKTSTQFNNNVQWKQYGLFLKTKPSVNALKHLKIEIDLRLSSLDQSLSSEGVPALMQSQLKTEINMKKVSPFLLSGFFQQDQGDSRSGLPWLQQIPLFKPLFSSGQIYNNELELVFILVPEFYYENSESL